MMAADVEYTCENAALEYARAGLRVFPLHSMRQVGTTSVYRCTCGRAKCDDAAKHPRTEHGCKDASSDVGTVAAWWKRWPDANVGIATGSGLVVLDVDPRHGGTTVGLDLPDTRRAVTGGGGEHWYFWCSDGEDVPCSSQLVGEGIDIRGDGGYVVAPPSLHASGRRYGWDSGAPEKAQAVPPWLLGLARQRRSGARTGSAGVADAFIDGGRNNGLTALAGSMVRKGFSENAVRAALLEENAVRCRPPLDDREVTKIAWSVSRYPATDPVRPDAADPEVDTQDAVKKTSLVEWLDTEGLLLGPLDPPTWVVQGLEIGPGRPGGLWGYGGTGKSWIAIGLALSISSGQRFLSWDIRPGKVAHVSHELGTFALKERYRRLASGMLIDPTDLSGNLKVCAYPKVYLNSPKAEDWYCRELEGHTLCVIDSLRRALPGEDENDSSISNHLDMLARVSDKLGVAFMVLHHSGKDAVRARPGKPNANEDKRGAGRGSSAIFDASSSVWLVEGGGKGPRKLTQIRAHDNGEGIQESVWLELTDWAVGEPMYASNRKPQRLIQLEEKEVADRERKAKRKGNLADWAEKCRTVYAAVQDAAGLATQRLLEREVGGRAETLRQLLQDMVEAEVLVSAEGPKRSKLFKAGPGDLEDFLSPKTAQERDMEAFDDVFQD